MKLKKSLILIGIPITLSPTFLVMSCSSSSPDKKPEDNNETIDVKATIVSDDNFEFEELGTYFVSVELDKQIDGITYEWTLPSGVVTPSSSLDQKTISFTINFEHDFEILVRVLKDGKEIAKASQNVKFNNSTIPPQPTPTYDVTFTGINQKFYVNNQYTIGATLNPSLPNAFYEWQSSSNNLGLSVSTSNEITINPTLDGNYTITLNIYKDSSKSEQIITNKQLNIDVNDYVIDVLPQASYDTNKSYSLTANVNPSDTYTYQWSSSDINLKLTNDTSKTVQFISNVAGSYQLNLSVYKNGQIIGSEQIIINFVDANPN